MHRSLAVLFCAAAVLAQDKTTAKPKLDARQFVPSGYRCECFVDFAALDDCGIWTSVRKSVFGMMLGEVEKQLGFELAELKTLRAYPDTTTSVARTEGHVDSTIAIFEGSNNVTLPPHDPNEGTEEIELAGVPALVNSRDAASWLLPKPGLLILGHRRHLEAVLAGKGHPGVPDDEFMTLLAGKDLLHVIALVDRAQTSEMPEIVQSLPWVDGDLPTCFLLRLRLITPAKDKASGDAPEPQVVLEVVVRHATGKSGPAMLQEQVAKGLEFLSKHKQLGAQKRLWSKVESKVDGRDLRLSLSLGRARDASAIFGSLLGPLFMGTMTVAGQEAAQLVDETDSAAPVTEEKEKGKEKPKEKEKEKPKEAPKPNGGGNGNGGG
jgi:hypothetical protein